MPPVRDLGEHRLKDLVGAERLFQLGEGEFPPLRTLDATNLPVVSIPLVGRERELQELVALLSERDATVDGHRDRRHREDAPRPAGRRRARRDAARRRVLDPARGTVRPRARAVRDRAGGREHRTTSPASCAAGSSSSSSTTSSTSSTRRPRSASCLASSSGLRVLVTSRTPLHVSAEQEYRLEPLPEDDAGDALRPASARGRARAHGRRDRRRDLPAPRRPPAGDRARRGANEAPRPRAAPRATRLRPPAPDRRGARRAGASAHAARDDRVELRPPRSGRPGALRPPRRLRGRVPARGRGGRRGCGSRRPRRPRRLEPREADRRRPLPDARDDPRVRGRAARHVGGRGRDPAAPRRRSSRSLPRRRTSTASTPRRSGPSGWSSTTTTSASHSTGWPRATRTARSRSRARWAGSGSRTATSPRGAIGSRERSPRWPTSRRTPPVR